MKYFIFRPSENLCEVEVGQEFQLESDGLWYVLLQRNSLECIIARETWLDKVGRFIRGETNASRYTGETRNGNSTTN